MQVATLISHLGTSLHGPHMQKDVCTCESSQRSHHAWEPPVLLAAEQDSMPGRAGFLCASLSVCDYVCRRRVGVSDTRMRKWLLSISAFLRTNNRGVGDAISMWRRNVESEFEGVEPCLICYSVIAATNSALPRHQCHTCGVRERACCYVVNPVTVSAVWFGRVCAVTGSAKHACTY